MKYLILILKNIGRNRLRSILTALGTMVLVFVVILVWSVLAFLDEATAEKNQNIKAIVTERWQVPSRMPLAYAASLSEGAARKPGDVRPLEAMAWQFYGGTLDPAKRTRESILFCIALEPEKLRMLDELDNLPPDQDAKIGVMIKRLKENRRGVLIGRERLQAIVGKSQITSPDDYLGKRFKIFSYNYKNIDLEFEIVGMLPEGRYDNTAIMNRSYLNDAVDAYNRTPGNPKHPMTDRRLNLVWLRVENHEQLTRLSAQIASSPYYSNPAVKCETASSAIASFLDSFRDLIWGMRWLLCPAVLVTLSLVIANAISISVRERRVELAVLKVLGFRPHQVLLLVLGESLILGAAAGLASATLTFVIINYWFGGLKFPIGFFASFHIPTAAFGWGLGVGAGTALLGSLAPAWMARNVKVADVFSKVA
jgi:putative ABC transport system permease protein